MVEQKKKVFWQALVFTVIIFVLGMLFGFFLEQNRADKAQFNLLESETNVLDDELRNKILDSFNVECGLALRSTFDFADKIYLEAAKLEQYGAAAKFTDSHLFLHRRYDLLRTLLWNQAIELKEKCGENFHTVVYLYQYDLDNLEIDSKQLFYSRLIFDLKQKYPDKVLLIPIAVNTDLSSVDLIVDSYDLEDFPKIIIDERHIIDEIVKIEDLENIVFNATINLK